jgi:hypothetical protein
MGVGNTLTQRRQGAKGARDGNGNGTSATDEHGSTRINGNGYFAADSRGFARMNGNGYCNATADGRR